MIKGSAFLYLHKINSGLMAISARQTNPRTLIPHAIRMHERDTSCFLKEPNRLTRRRFEQEIEQERRKRKRRRQHRNYDRELIIHGIKWNGRERNTQKKRGLGIKQFASELHLDTSSTSKMESQRSVSKPYDWCQTVTAEVTRERNKKEKKSIGSKQCVE